ncbi:hypothetical protein Tco_1028642, partial [Tanacetum coccineum]
GITMIDHTQAEAMGKLSNVLCQVGATTIIAKFLILDIPIDHDAPIVVGRGFLPTMAESDSDDEEEYVIKRNKFGAPIYRPRPTPYLNCANPEDRSSAIQAVTNPLQEHMTEKPDRHDPNAQEMKPWKRYCFHKFTTSFYYGNDVPEMLNLAESEEDIFTSVAWIRAFNINEPIYAKLCHEFYSTYEFDEVCADDELQSNKIIRLRLGGRTHSLNLLEFARRLGLYQVVELEDDGFNVYFEGGLRSDDNFNATDYWLSINEPIYDAWTRFKNLIKRVPHHGLDLWSLTQFFYDYVDDYTRMELDFAVDGNLGELSGEEAWEAIECFAQGQKEWDNPPNIIFEQEVANLKAQAKRLFGNEDV